MFRLAIIIGSTRPGRNGEAVAKWIYEIARQRTDIEVELVDIKDYNLPLLDEPQPASSGQYTQDHTKKWAEKIELVRRFCIRHPRIQSLPACLTEKRDRLPVFRMEQQIGRICRLWFDGRYPCHRTAPHPDGSADDRRRQGGSHVVSL